MLKKRKAALWLFLLLAAVNLAGTFAALRLYPGFSIGRTALLEENKPNLKEFTLEEDGSLTSFSEDPWISYIFGSPVNIRFLTVEVSRVAGTRTRAQLFLMPSASFRSMDLRDGRLSARFGLADGCMGVGGVRLDMATEPGASLFVEQVIINDPLAVILDFQRYFAAFLAVFLVILAEISGWRRLFYEAEGTKKRRLRGILVPALFQAAMKAAIIWVLKEPLLRNDGTGRQHLLSWLFLWGLELFVVLVLHLGAEKKKGTLWHSLLAVLPFSLLWFSAAELLNMETFDFQTASYLVFNLLLCALVPAVFLLVFRNRALGFSAAALAFAALSVGNHYYGMLRNNPLEFFDIANAETAVHVLGNYSLTPDGVSLAAIFAAAVTVVTAVSAFGIRGFGWRLPSVAGGLLVAGIMAGVIFIKIPVIGNFANLPMITREMGYFLSFASFIKMGRVEKPKGYSPKRAAEILSASESPAVEGRRPNVIVIMDETLADLPEIYGFETTAEVLPNLHALKENTVSGQVLVSVYGGGTANTEYEFLTGNSLYFLPPGSSPYVQYLGSRQQSLAWKFQELGYHVAAYHPYLALSYRRSVVYPRLGLDPFYSEETPLPHGETLRAYVSDRADFQNVIHLYEQKEAGKPLFLFNVTMQNHGGYSMEEPEVEVTVRPVDEELNTPSMAEYLSLIHETDAAFQELVDYFSREEEDTILLIFGDHQPSMEEPVAEFMERKAAESGKEADFRLRYYATFAIWANFDIEEQTGVLTSPNFLRSMVLRYGGVEQNGYETFLDKLSRAYPAMNAFGVLDSQGVWHGRGEEESELLSQYETLVYQNVFDRKTMEEAYR